MLEQSLSSTISWLPCLEMFCFIFAILFFKPPMKLILTVDLVIFLSNESLVSKIWVQERVKQAQKHFLFNQPTKRYDAFHMILHSVWLRRLNIHINSIQDQLTLQLTWQILLGEPSELTGLSPYLTHVYPSGPACSLVSIWYMQLGTEAVSNCQGTPIAPLLPIPQT